MVNDREERLEQILAEFKDGGNAAADTVDTATPAPQNDAAGQSDVADETAPESEAESEAPIEIEPVPVQRRRQHAEPKDGEREKPKFSGMRILLLAAGFVLLIAALFLPKDGWVRIALSAAAFLLAGYDVLEDAVKSVIHGQILDERLLIALASIIGLCIGMFPGGAAVMLCFRAGEMLQEAAAERSLKTAAALEESLPRMARVQRGDEVTELAPDEVQVGETIIVEPGEVIPLDGEVLEDMTAVDVSPLTGRAGTRTLNAGGAAMSGCINITRTISIRVTREFKDSTVRRLCDIAANTASVRSGQERFTASCARIYTPAAAIFALVIAVLPPLFGGEWVKWIVRALTVLVLSSPCAMAVSVPLAYSAGIRRAACSGMYAKTAQDIESFTKTDTIVFDKTGTVTEGRFAVTEVFPESMSEQELLNIAATAESCSRHPIARSLREAGNVKPSDGEVLEIEDISGRGVSAFIDGHHVYVGNAALLEEHGINFSVPSRPGAAIHVAVDNVYAGHIMIADRIKDGAFDALEELRAQGVKSLVMLTGDVRSAAKTVASSLNFDMVKAELTLDGKITAVEYMLSKKATGACLAFVGDGVGDAPVMTHADIGIALGAVNEYSAIDAADVVLMDEDIRALPEARSLCRSVTDTAGQNILLSLAAKAILVVLGVFGVINIWIAALAELCVLAAAIANAGKNDIKFEKENIDERSVQ